MQGDVRNFLVNSDYPMDSVIWTGEGDISAPAHDYSDVVISHGLPYTPLVIGQFSTDNGATWLPFTPSSAMYGYYVNAVAYPDNITVTLQTSTADVSAKFRMWAFAPADADGIITPPTSSSDFILNSDYNYSKLVHAGVWEVQAGDKQTIYTHGLGYIPEVMTWAERSNGGISTRFQEISSDTSLQDELYIQIDENNLYGKASAVNNIVKIHYRIYGDQNG